MGWVKRNRPAKKGEKVESEREMFVSIFWNDRRLSVPLDQLECVDREGEKDGRLSVA